MGKITRQELDATLIDELNNSSQFQSDTQAYKTIKSNKDANGVFTTVEHRRKSDDTLIQKAVLSGGTSPQYTTRTITIYDTDGTTILNTVVNTLSYDADNVLVSEV